MRIKITILIMLTLFIFSGCTTTSTETGKGAIKGAAIGAGIGAGIGALVGGKGFRKQTAGVGATIGAAMGAPLGAFFGHVKGKNKQNMEDTKRRLQESEEGEGGYAGDEEQYEEQEYGEEDSEDDSSTNPEEVSEIDIPVVMDGEEEVEPAYTRTMVDDHWTYTPTFDFDQEDLYRRVADSEGRWKYEPFYADDMDSDVNGEIEIDSEMDGIREIIDTDEIIEATEEIVEIEEADNTETDNMGTYNSTMGDVDSVEELKTMLQEEPK